MICSQIFRAPLNSSNVYPSIRANLVAPAVLQFTWGEVETYQIYSLDGDHGLANGNCTDIALYGPAANYQSTAPLVLDLTPTGAGASTDDPYHSPPVPSMTQSQANTAEATICAGTAYVAVLTAGFPTNGIMRANLGPETQYPWVFPLADCYPAWSSYGNFYLNVASMLPPPSPTPTTLEGYVFIMLYYNYNVAVISISTPAVLTGAKIFGPVNNCSSVSQVQNSQASVLMTLNVATSNPEASASGQQYLNQYTLTAAQLYALCNQQTFLITYTAANPNGEQRANLFMNCSDWASFPPPRCQSGSTTTGATTTTSSTTTSTTTSTTGATTTTTGPASTPSRTIGAPPVAQPILALLFAAVCVLAA